MAPGTQIVIARFVLQYRESLRWKGFALWMEMPEIVLALIRNPTTILNHKHLAYRHQDQSARARQSIWPLVHLSADCRPSHDHFYPKRSLDLAPGSASPTPNNPESFLAADCRPPKDAEAICFESAELACR
jgi:hypothetical protein